MKKLILAIFVLGFVSLAGTARAQMGMMGNYWQDNSSISSASQSKEVNDVLQSIYSSQNITNQDKVNCSLVSDDQFEELGDAYMGVMMPDENQHETMDEMMGGEGSKSLRQAHINMGRSYLGCWSDYNSKPVYMPMMGVGGMMGGYGNNVSMMGGGYFPRVSSVSWLFVLTTFVWLVVGLLFLVLIIKKLKKSNK